MCSPTVCPFLLIRFEPPCLPAVPVTRPDNTTVASSKKAKAKGKAKANPKRGTKRPKVGVSGVTSKVQLIYMFFSLSESHHMRKTTLLQKHSKNCRRTRSRPATYQQFACSRKPPACRPSPASPTVLWKSRKSKGNSGKVVCQLLSH